MVHFYSQYGEWVFTRSHPATRPFFPPPTAKPSLPPVSQRHRSRSSRRSGSRAAKPTSTAPRVRARRRAPDPEGFGGGGPKNRRQNDSFNCIPKTGNMSRLVKTMWKLDYAKTSGKICSPPPAFVLFVSLHDTPHPSSFPSSSGDALQDPSTPGRD